MTKFTKLTFLVLLFTISAADTPNSKKVSKATSKSKSQARNDQFTCWKASTKTNEVAISDTTDAYSEHVVILPSDTAKIEAIQNSSGCYDFIKKKEGDAILKNDALVSKLTANELAADKKCCFKNLQMKNLRKTILMKKSKSKHLKAKASKKSRSITRKYK